MRRKLTPLQLAQRHLDLAIRGLVGCVRFDVLKKQKMTTVEAMEVIATFLDECSPGTYDWAATLEEIREEAADAIEKRRKEKHAKARR
jgi:hypothetical protein